MKQEIQLLHKSEAVIFFMDGSQFEGKSGARIVIYQNTPGLDKR